MDQPSFPKTPPTRAPQTHDAVPATRNDVTPGSPPITAEMMGGLWSVPGYDLQGVLGRGGMGVVYKARHVALGRTVAIKVVLHHAHAGPEAHERFRGEARAIARLQHPNIVQIHEIGECHGLPYFSLEYCPGGSLAQRLAKAGPLAPREAAELVRTLALALHAAHAEGVVHRDLKPANVLLTGDGTPKVADFGLAKVADESDRTRSGMILGTPEYMAPEQARGKARQVGPAADVYALGAILYECLTGRPPFHAETPMETMLQAIADRPRPPRSLRPEIPRSLEAICLRCLEKDAADRPASARALAEELEAYLAGKAPGEPWLARVVRKAERVWQRSAVRGPAMMRLGIGCVLLVLMLSVWPFHSSRSQSGEGERTAQVPEKGIDPPGQPSGRLPELYGLMVGVNDYSGVKGYRLNNLPDSMLHAGEMSRLFQIQEGFMYRAVALEFLASKEVTSEAILTRLRAIGRQVEADDWVVVYLAGRGGAELLAADVYKPGSFFFFCSDTDRERPKTRLSSKDLYDALADIRCNRLILLECCHSGDFASNPHRNLGEKFYVFASSRADQRTLEPKARAALFSGALLAELRRRDRPGFVHLDALQRGCRESMKDLLERDESDPDVQVPVFHPAVMPKVAIALRFPKR